ncbi:unnamed protein product [Meloidogyne enterolobii]|uniref:Uncharacterized protein n=1 Tax=Meloidogyne enterolobii TaxID=390850 RepID=A0ACB1A5R7_MELEN
MHILFGPTLLLFSQALPTKFFPPFFQILYRSIRCPDRLILDWLDIFLGKLGRKKEEDIASRELAKSSILPFLSLSCPLCQFPSFCLFY